MPDPTLSISRGALAPIGEFRDIWIFRQLRKIADAQGESLAKAFDSLP